MNDLRCGLRQIKFSGPPVTGGRSPSRPTARPINSMRPLRTP